LFVAGLFVLGATTGFVRAAELADDVQSSDPAIVAESVQAEVIANDQAERGAAQTRALRRAALEAKASASLSAQQVALDSHPSALAEAGATPAKSDLLAAAALPVAAVAPNPVSAASAPEGASVATALPSPANATVANASPRGPAVPQATATESPVADAGPIAPLFVPLSAAAALTEPSEASVQDEVIADDQAIVVAEQRRQERLVAQAAAQAAARARAEAARQMVAAREVPADSAAGSPGVGSVGGTQSAQAPLQAPAAGTTGALSAGTGPAAATAGAIEGSEAGGVVTIPLEPPQQQPLTYPLPPIDPNQVEPPMPAAPRESVPVPDRWRIMEALDLKDDPTNAYHQDSFKDDPLNPYHQNTYKGDKPFTPLGFLGPDWFVSVSAISDTVYQASRIPIPIDPAGADRSGSYDTFGHPNLKSVSQTEIISVSVIEGDTTFRPPDYEIRLTPAFNYNYAQAQERGVLNVDPAQGLTRSDGFATLQEAFLDMHLRNVSDNYDFDSLRVGIQPFTSDFRGFIFQDSAFGVRLFGTRDSNLWQYNLAWLDRIEKDTNSGLNDLGAGLRRDQTFIANAYRQDFPVPGHTTEFIILHNINDEDNQPFYDSNGFLQRPAPVGDGLPHHYEVTYVGLNGDGHFGRWNLTSSLYGAFGTDSHNPIAGREERIAAGFAAAELSRDFDWARVRATAVYASGDNNPYGSTASGFDAIRENPDIAGADTSFWIRQAIPLIGGGGVVLSGSNALLPSLRTSEDQGQSNFVNPGLTLLGIGADFDLTPQLRLLTNVSKLDFVNTATLEVLRNQGNISRDIGVDVSAGLQYRPFFTQNIVLNASVAMLSPGHGFRQLFDTEHLGTPYSLLFNLIMRY
jgi:hypothetical protein